MNNNTRELLNSYFSRQAELNGVAESTVATGKQFNVEPSVQQKLETKIQESSGFLSRINMIGVDEQEGETLGLDISGPIASRVDTEATNSKGRQTRDISTLNKESYRCEQTNYDSHITYKKLDMWAKFPDFQQRITNLLINRAALDRITIGFNGESVAATTDLATNPLLQDVNKGWLQKYREHANGKRVLTEGVAGTGKVTVGETGDYKSLDALAFDVINSFIDPWYQDDASLVAIMGRDLYSDVNFKKINKVYDPMNEQAMNTLMQTGMVGNTPVIRLPFVPTGAMFITSLQNLSIYFQTGKNRRTFVDNAKFNRLETYSSSNDSFVVEDYGFGGLVENIALV
ncbi:MAG: phage major capsid protein, P2 family [Gammaproteobacteria bacterium]|nr:MAG: phage major capsid protein, P2 family [Gammaproteobacteria bacterium]